MADDLEVFKQLRTTNAEQAREIERLNTNSDNQIRHMDEKWKTLGAEITRLEAANGELVGALDRMLWLFTSDPPCAKPTAPTMKCESGMVPVMQAREQARAALARVEGEK